MKKINTKVLTTNSMIIALFIMFTFVPSIGYIVIGPIQFTLIHILFLVGMQTLFMTTKIHFWLAGLIYGIVFGISSWLQAITFPSVPSFIFINPLFSIVPRALMGLVVGFIATIIDYYHNVVKSKLEKQQQKWRKIYLKADQIIVAVAAATFNTLFVLGFLLLFGPLLYHNPSDIAFFKAIGLIVLLTNYLPEAIVAALVFPPIAYSLKQMKYFA